MKRSTSTVLAVLVALLTLLWLTGLAGASRNPEPLTPAAGAPTLVSYQGQVTMNGTPYTGAGYFKFAIVNQAGSTTYWSNDDSSLGGAEPDKPVSLVVSSGLFNVLLGDTSLDNMTELPASAFAGADRWLRVWFSDDGSTFALLSPDRRIAAAPYALQAEEALSAATATDADALDGQHGSFYQDAGNLKAGTVATDRYSAQADLAAEGYLGNAAGDLAQNNNLLQSTLDADMLDSLHASAFATSSHTHATLNAGAGLSGGNYNGGAAATFAVTYGTAAGSAVQGNQTATITAGTGLTGGVSSDALGDGFNATLNVGGGSGITANADNLALGPLTANWSQTGAFDIVLGNAASELQILESAGATYYGVFDVGDLSANQTYAFTTGGAVWTSGNDGSGSTLDADLLDGYQAGNASGSVPLSNGTLNTNLNADLLDGVQGSDYQARVGDACPTGQSIRTVNADGSVDCEPHATSRSVPPQAKNITYLSPGRHNSITIGTDGLPVMSYYDLTDFDLKVLHCGNAACMAGNTITAVDASGDVGAYNAIAIGADGLPVISYYDGTNGDLKVAHCGDAGCTAGNTLTAVDTAGNPGTYTSINIASDGYPMISYYDNTNFDLRVADCSDRACTYRSIITVDSTGDTGTYGSSTIGSDGMLVIAYYDVTNHDLNVAHCDNDYCSSFTITAVDSAGDVGQYTSITTGVDGLPVISYYDVDNYSLKVAHCGNVACTAGNTLTTVDATPYVAGQYTSITIGADGLPIVSHYAYDYYNSYLKVAHCANAACTSSTSVWADYGAGAYTSITIGADGLPLVSYQGYTSGTLAVLHCSNAFCVPYFRRR